MEPLHAHFGLADNSRPTSQSSSSSTGSDGQPPPAWPAAEEGDSSAGDFGVGSTVLTRDAQRDEFEIHTVGGLTKRRDKVSRRCWQIQQGPLTTSCGGGGSGQLSGPLRWALTAMSLFSLLMLLLQCDCLNNDSCL